MNVLKKSTFKPQLKKALLPKLDFFLIISLFYNHCHISKRKKAMLFLEHKKESLRIQIFTIYVPCIYKYKMLVDKLQKIIKSNKVVIIT